MPTLNWIGKEKIISHHLEVPYRVLEHQYGFTEKGQQEEPTGSGNMIIHGDNLEALKALLPKYEGKVNCIYIDPPYNTGKEHWLYTDKVNHPKIEKWFDRIVGREGEDLSRNDKWLCMMYPRMKLLHKLLADDGVFFCSVDDYEQANLKLQLDEIFGAGNFLNNIIWQRAFSPINTKKRFSPNHDFILCYAKNVNAVEFLLKRTQEANDRYANPDNDPRGVWTSGDLSVGPVIGEQVYEIITPGGRSVFPPSGYCWRVKRNKLDELIADNRIWFGEKGDNVPRIKRFISEVKEGITPMTVWTSKEVGHNQDAKQEIKKIFPESSLPFDTPKPLSLIKRILDLRSDKDAIVLDSFSGSGTTAHAVLNLNREDGGKRKFILIEMEDYAETITSERLRRVISGYTNTEGTGGAFDYYELGETLFDEQNNLNAQLDPEKIKEYIWFTETRSSYMPTVFPYYLGMYNDTGYYFIYERDSRTTVDYSLLAEHVKTKAERYVIYADNCLLPEKFMLEHNIEFKKIPRDITRF